MFFDNQYPVNIKDAMTIFYPANSLALGDNILWTIIFQHYQVTNTDEAVQFLAFNADILGLVQSEKYDKLFVRLPSCLTDRTLEELRRHVAVFPYEFEKECHELWKMGTYPSLNKACDANMLPMFEEQKINHINGLSLNPYVVVHFRNCRMLPGKNADPVIVRNVMEKIIQTGMDVFLVGNDNSYGPDIEFLDCDQVHDVRRKLSLQKIADLMRSCQLFVGSDSGICHLAGCFDMPMVCWNFMNEYWFPKVKVRDMDRCLFLVKEESKVEVITREVKRKLKV